MKNFLVLLLLISFISENKAQSLEKSIGLYYTNLDFVTVTPRHNEILSETRAFSGNSLRQVGLHYRIKKRFYYFDAAIGFGFKRSEGGTQTGFNGNIYQSDVEGRTFGSKGRLAFGVFTPLGFVKPVKIGAAVGLSPYFFRGLENPSNPDYFATETITIGSSVDFIPEVNIDFLRSFNIAIQLPIPLVNFADENYAHLVNGEKVNTAPEFSGFRSRNILDVYAWLSFSLRYRFGN